MGCCENNCSVPAMTKKRISGPGQAQQASALMQGPIFEGGHFPCPPWRGNWESTSARRNFPARKGFPTGSRKKRQPVHPKTVALARRKRLVSGARAATERRTARRNSKVRFSPGFMEGFGGIRIPNGKVNESKSLARKKQLPRKILKSASRPLSMGPAPRFLRQFNPFGADLSVCKNVLEF